MKFEFVENNKKYNARLKVVGVGGGGGNAINNMINAKLKGVDFIVANTDSQDLERSECSQRIQLGPNITMGLGAGADPDVGRQSAEESINEIRDAIDKPDMVFITAGMGGGTGTGACPVIARECRELDALTVAVATKPFKFEGEKRMKRALEGIEMLKREVDSLIIIPNERLKALSNRSTTFKDLMAKADDVLLQAVRGISDLIMSNGFINLDFADVKKVMQQMGTAIMGMGKATGENRAAEAAQMAINSPFLEDISIRGAQGLLMNITGPADMTMEEIDDASNYIKGEVNEDADIFWGVVLDDAMEDEIQVTVIATGIDSDDVGGLGSYRESIRSNVVELGKVRDLTPEEAQESWSVRVPKSLDTPTYKRNNKDLHVPRFDGEEERKEDGRKKKGLLGKLHIMDNLDYPTFLRAMDD